MEKISNKEHYEKYGYFVIPQAFTKEEMQGIRETIKQVFAQPVEYDGDRKNIRFLPQVRYPSLRKFISNKKFIEGLREVFGNDFVIYPEEAMHDSGIAGTWHKDTNTQETAGYMYHYEPEFNVATIGIYFQENDENYAGGLDIVPGSHKTKATWWQNLRVRNRYVKYLLHHLDVRGLIPHSLRHGLKGAMPIRHQLGDIVVFNMLLDHRPSHAKIKPVPDQFRKYACFLKCGSNNKYTMAYLDFLKTRPDYGYLKSFDYPTEYKQIADEMKVNLLC